MEQRNAGGQSRAPITTQDNWDGYTADTALLDRPAHRPLSAVQSVCWRIHPDPGSSSRVRCAIGTMRGALCFKSRMNQFGRSEN
jgi:hypothetical protein